MPTGEVEVWVFWILFYPSLLVEQQVFFLILPFLIVFLVQLDLDLDLVQWLQEVRNLKMPTGEVEVWVFWILFYPSLLVEQQVFFLILPFLIVFLVQLDLDLDLVQWLQEVRNLKMMDLVQWLQEVRNLKMPTGGVEVPDLLFHLHYPVFPRLLGLLPELYQNLLMYFYILQLV